MSFVDNLVGKKLISAEEAAISQKEAQSSGESLEALLISKGVDPADILEAKGEYFNIPTRKLDEKKIPFDILKQIPEESVKYYQFVPIGLNDGILEVGVVNTDNLTEARDALQFISSKTNTPYKIFLISQEDFTKVVDSYEGLHGQVSQALSELETELSSRPATSKEDGESKEDDGIPQSIDAGIEEIDTGGPIKTKIIEDAPVTRIVATILKYAIEGEASDIHIEPMDEKVRVRFRVDGEMHTSLILPLKIHNAVVARIKVLSNMRLDEKRKPQDGRFPAHLGGRKIDFRVSTLPTYYGEKVVMRILDSEKGVIGLENIGLSKRNLDLIKDAIKRPYGLILISGPTGSGKTTTLYSMLEGLDKDKKNVLSLEDPVEYNIPGLNQSQVRPEIGYTFATGLRTTLRQDPDIIMVGEIRDAETAKLAIQAALTGHLVLSTIHTNNAVGVIPRLVDMGVDPYLIAPTLILAMAQRLVSTLCEGTGKKIPVEESLQVMIDKQFADLPDEYKKEFMPIKEVYEAEPDGTCPEGVKGRMAVFEVLKMDKELERIILRGGSEQDIMNIARKQGMLNMMEDAILKSSQKLIPFSEVNKLRSSVDDISVKDDEENKRDKEIINDATV